ncbi:TRS130 [Candida margitis]|uniref:TRS130 n=1 Tax=Candida margitis TaxID=1775924 RepID=UPI002225DE45|nr:TRS130 [Candida margitis]KAI5964941.1 TRS130 [Candida margitis]
MSDHSQLDLVRIGYYDPFGVYPHIQKEISKRLPLSNLHIRLKPNQSVKTISKLDVEFVEEVPKKGDYVTHDIKTYVRLIFVQVDSLDKYRGQVRPLVREWLKNLVLKTNCSWMIVLHVPLDAKDRSSSIIKTSFFDKLQNDFGPEGKELKTILPMGDTIKNFGDRVFKLKQVPEEDIYAAFITQLKTLLSNSFVDRYHTFNDLIRQRKHVSIEEFAAKLELYNLLKDMKLLQDALNVNEDLSVDLDNLVAHHGELFNHELQLTQSLTDFNFDEFVNEEQLKQQLINLEPINLIQLKSLVFVNESFILQELARTAVSNSIASKHISRLYQRLMLFLNDSHFNNNNELVYLLIDSFLQIPIVQQLVDSVHVSDVDDGNEVSLLDILEMRAELKLFKRTVISKIAKQNHIEVDGLRGGGAVVGGDAFEEIALDNEPSASPITLQNPDLIKIVSDKNSYVDYYFNLTEDIIGDFVKCNRVKSIDILSLDLAILNYNQGNYQECLDTLQNSYDYFIMNSWNFLGGILLEIYLGCVEKLGHDGGDGDRDLDEQEEVLKTCLNLLSCLVKSTDSVGINSYKLVRDSNHVAKIFTKINENSHNLTKPLEYPLLDFFKVQVKPYVNQDDSTTDDVYYLEVEIFNSFNVPVKFASIELILIDEEKSQLSFRTDDVELLESSGGQTFKLYTRDIKFGLFSSHRLVILFNEKLSFCHKYCPLNGGDGGDDIEVAPDTSIFNDTVVEIKNSLIKPNPTLSTDIVTFQSVNKFQAQFFSSRVIELGTTEVSLVLTNGSNDISNVQILLSSSTEGVRLSQPEVTIESLKASDGQTLQVPYICFNDQKSVNMRAHIRYFAGVTQYSAQISYNVDTRLSISVSVQDVFKTNFFYSKFQVGTVDARSPIRLVSNNLQSDDYEVNSPGNQFHHLIAFGEQPISFFYKISPKQGHSIDEEDKLDLSLRYTNLSDECEQRLDAIVATALKEVKLIKYWYLIKETILSKVQFDLNMYGVEQVVKVVNNQQIKALADRIIGRYIEHKHDQLELHKIIANLNNENHSTEELENGNKIQHQLKIKVAVPLLKYLHVVEYVYDRKTHTVGEPIPITLHIRTVTNWSDNSKKEVLAVSSPSKSTNDGDGSDDTSGAHDGGEIFQAMVQPDDNWVISGFKKQTFSLGSSFETPLVLIPLHVGKLPLPKIVINSTEGTGTTTTATTTTAAMNNSDIEFVNGSETIMSVPDVRHIQFSF